jgi:hypothetical protein
MRIWWIFGAERGRPFDDFQDLLPLDGGVRLLLLYFLAEVWSLVEFYLKIFLLLFKDEFLGQLFFSQFFKNKLSILSLKS